ncbi:MAG TPA: winged helix-turn-helix domain-containing protein [Candidatus Baltobacteraceae bacterium]|nr:winged helix-turn-helix domain-containing protein [Candidatus Baltobacteraceae bacterium]
MAKIGADAPAVFSFGSFLLDANRRALLRGGRVVHLTPRSFDVLEYLVQQDGRLVTHEDLEKYVWYGASVTDANIAKHVQLVRQAIGDTAKPYVYLRTVPSRGFRFVSARREK